MMAALRPASRRRSRSSTASLAVRAKIVDLVLVAGAGAPPARVDRDHCRRPDRRARGGERGRAQGLDGGQASEILGIAVPLVVVTVVAMLLYRFVPARRPRFRDAVAGGVVTGLLLLAISAGSAFVYNQVAELSVIYGSITAVLVSYSVYLYASAIERRALAGAWSMPRDGAVGLAPRAGAPRVRRGSQQAPPPW